MVCATHSLGCYKSTKISAYLRTPYRFLVKHRRSQLPTSKLTESTQKPSNADYRTASGVCIDPSSTQQSVRAGESPQLVNALWSFLTDKNTKFCIQQARVPLLYFNCVSKEVKPVTTPVPGAWATTLRLFGTTDDSRFVALVRRAGGRALFSSFCTPALRLFPDMSNL